MEQTIKWSGKLISVGNNAKTIKGDKGEYLTAIMYLAPYTLSGYNTCSMAHVAQCHEGCLNTAGRGAFNNVQKARIKKTQFFMERKNEFLATLESDLTKFVKFCEKHNVKPCVRLNGTSDIRWERHGIIEKFPNIQFYDYTKIANRNVPEDYHLTFSYSEASDVYKKQVEIAKAKMMNIAVVFRSKETMPKEFINREVIDGDRDDLRFLDGKNVIVGLYAKGKAKKDTSGFVIDVRK